MKNLFYSSVCLLCTCPALAQSETTEFINPPTQFTESEVNGYRWGVTLGVDSLAAQNGHAQERSVSLRRYGLDGSIALERLDSQRFGLRDSAWAVDAYPRLWPGAYAHVRYQQSDAHLLYPRLSWRAELYQNLEGGWEVSASRDELKFSSPVQIDGIGLAKYWGNFYLRWRHQSVSSDSSSGQGDRLVLRYYYRGDADHYWEVNMANGRSMDDSGLATTLSRSDTKGLVWQHFWDRSWGVKAMASESKLASVSGGRERSVSARLMYRW